MELGMIGLGKMGGNMARRLLSGGHRVVAYDPVPEAVQAVVGQGTVGVASIGELVPRLARPRVIWVMVPHGEPTESAISTLTSVLSPGDTVIDGGNSYYKDSMRRAKSLAAKEVHFLDVGVSGGIRGLKEGYCLMVGGEHEIYERVIPVFQTLASAMDKGYGYVGPSGAGHFVKMVHNAIEYGLMEAYAGGFELMQAKKGLVVDTANVAEIWRFGSVIRSWMLDLTASILHEDANLEKIQAWVEDSGEGRWAVHEAVDMAVPIPVITEALQARFRSRQEQPFGARLLAALRSKFGGHEVKPAK